MNDIINTIINGKWEDVMSTIPDNSIDIIITSPPYNVDLGNNKHKKDAYEEYKDNLPYEKYLEWMDGLFRECYRVLRSGGRICINIGDGANGSIPTHADFTVRMRDMHKFLMMTTLVWNKKQIGASTAWGSWKSPSQPSFPTQFEFIIVMAKETLKHTGDPEKITVTDKEFITNSRALWEIQPETEMMKKYGHPAVYPEEMVRRLLNQLTYEDDIVLDPFSGCYDDETEVLTKCGWQYFANVTMDDQFITRDLDGNLKYESPIELHKYPYSGHLIHIKSRSTDLMVTPQHNMYVLSHVNFCKNRHPTFIQANDLSLSLYRIPCGGKYIPSKNKLTRETMYLIGLYLSEGYFQKERDKTSDNMIICQNPGAKNEKMKRNVSSFYPVQRDYRKFKVKIGYELQNFILKNCGKSKYNKFMSPEILDNVHLDALYEGMMDGDGCRSKCGQHHGKIYYHETYYTTSKTLANNFQELCLKLGYESRLAVRKVIRKNGLPGGGIIRGRKILQKFPCYEIYVRKSKHKKILPKKHITKKRYTGYVYCVTVPNHTLYVRRNGTTSWCGNSGTTCAVAKKLSRRYIGIEMSKKYCDTANARLRDVVALQKVKSEKTKKSGEEPGYTLEWMQ